MQITLTFTRKVQSQTFGNDGVCNSKWPILLSALSRFPQNGKRKRGRKEGELRMRERKVKAVGNFLFPPFFGMPTTRAKLFVSRPQFCRSGNIRLVLFCFVFLVKNVLFYSTLEIYSNTRILLMLYHSKRELPYLGVFVVITVVCGHVLATLNVFTIQTQS